MTVIDNDNDGKKMVRCDCYSLCLVSFDVASDVSERDLINDDSSVCSPILSAIDLQCHVFFPFEKLLSNVRLCR